MKLKQASVILDDILESLNNPKIAVVGPGVNEDFEIIDSSLIYYLNRIELCGQVHIVDNKPFFMKMYKKKIDNFDFDYTRNIYFRLASADNLENTLHSDFDIISYHCTLPPIDSDNNLLKKWVDSAEEVLNTHGNLVFMFFNKRSEYMLYKRSCVSYVNLKKILKKDFRFKTKEYDILDEYKINGRTRHSSTLSFFEINKNNFISSYNNCNKMIIATKL